MPDQDLWGEDAMGWYLSERHLRLRRVPRPVSGPWLASEKLFAAALQRADSHHLIFIPFVWSRFIQVSNWAHVRGLWNWTDMKSLSFRDLRDKTWTSRQLMIYVAAPGRGGGVGGGVWSITLRTESGKFGFPSKYFMFSSHSPESGFWFMRLW